ncbi:putative NAD/FAD-binding protein [Bradyrhizobium sp. AZCC 1693]
MPWRAKNAGCGGRDGNQRQCRRLDLVETLSGELRPGGHSHTVSIDYDGTQLAVDIGFIVYNELNYPDLKALFAYLGVETIESCMSFAVTADTGRFEWKGGGNNWFETARGLFAQASNLLSPSYLWMLRDIITFNQQSLFLLSR